MQIDGAHPACKKDRKKEAISRFRIWKGYHDDKMNSRADAEYGEVNGFLIKY